MGTTGAFLDRPPHPSQCETVPSSLVLLEATGLTKGNLSSHLSKLEQAGYVAIEKTYRGKIPWTLIRLTPQGRQAFDAYREQLRAIAARLPE